MIKHIKPLPISEEMLGAYLEGNLAQSDATYVEQMLQGNDDLSTFVNELSVSDDLMSNYQVEDIPSFENDFTLPEVPQNFENRMNSLENYDWRIHDGDYGYWELGLPPIVAEKCLQIEDNSTDNEQHEVNISEEIVDDRSYKDIDSFNYDIHEDDFDIDNFSDFDDFNDFEIL